MKVPFHIFYYYWNEEYHLLYWEVSLNGGPTVISWSIQECPGDVEKSEIVCAMIFSWSL